MLKRAMPVIVIARACHPVGNVKCKIYNEKWKMDIQDSPWTSKNLSMPPVVEFRALGNRQVWVLYLYRHEEQGSEYIRDIRMKNIFMIVLVMVLVLGLGQSVLGEGSARWALSEVYGVKQWRSDKGLQCRGPVYESSEIEGDKIIVSFEEGTERGLRLDQDDESGFYIGGKDREFHHARARILNGNKVQVRSEEVSEPMAVRYGWSNLPLGGLMNARELPAYPFRSDTWPLTPHQSTGAYEVDKYTY